MGLFGWLKGAPKEPEHKTARWLRDKIAAAKQAGDGVQLAGACAALAGGGAMAFGMVVSEFPGLAAVRDEAFAALQQLVPDLPERDCDRVFEIIDRPKLGIDVQARRGELAEARRIRSEYATEKLRAAIAKAAAGPLVDACVKLQFRDPRAFEIEVPVAAREALLEAALKRLATLIPALADDECDDVFHEIRRAKLPIDISARLAEIAERRREQRDNAIASASSGEPRNPELEAAIAANPGDAEAYTVLADWLHDRGHPRGELIALQLRAEHDASLAAAVESHLAQHAPVLLGPLEPYRTTLDGTDRRAFTWRRGFIHSALLSYDENVQRQPSGVADVLRVLIAHPSARYLEALAIGINGSSTDDTLEAVIDVLAEEPPPHLRELLLGDHTQDQVEISWYIIGNIERLWPALPGLRKLVTHGGGLEVGTIDAPALEHLEIKTGGLAAATARAIAAARCPRLRSLDVWYGDPNYDGDATIADVRPLLERTDLPKLVHLGLMNAAFSDEICRTLAGTPLAAQIRELDLSLGTLSDDGAAALVAAAGSLPRLKKLDVTNNFLSEAAVSALRAAFPAVVADDQREADDEDERYVAVGE
jgi:uncharacterized protein (TIGR02996 family)